jgi:hypothetical protein
MALNQHLTIQCEVLLEEFQLGEVLAPGERNMIDDGAEIVFHYGYLLELSGIGQGEQEEEVQRKVSLQVEFLRCIGVHIVLGEQQEKDFGNLHRIQLRADGLHVRLVLCAPRVIRYEGVVLRNIVVRLIFFTLIIFMMDSGALPPKLPTSGCS